MDSLTQKPHVVCVPYPAQGHINPFMQLTKLLHSKGFHITFVNTEFNHERLLRSQGPDFVKALPDFQFETIPDGLPPSNLDATQDIPALCDSIRKHCYRPFKELVMKLNSSTEGPKVSCILSDAIMSFAVLAAKDLGIPDVQFMTASACGFMGCLQLEELVKRGIVPFKDEKFLVDGTLETTVDEIPGMKDMRLKDLPNFIRTTNINDIMFNFVSSEAQYCLKSASSIILNTFEELESEVLDAIRVKNPNVYTIGPLHLQCRNLLEKESKLSGSSLWKSDSKCIQWLNKWEPNSVIYVNYGSITFMSEKHFKEFAWGLANSKHPFLWIVRQDAIMGESANFSQELLKEIKERSYITSWCPQSQVLAHSSVGAFLTHCGWNSTLESISEGLPMICWPFFSDQQPNCRFICKHWGIGMEVNQDVNREEVAALVKEVMEGAKGKEMRQKSLEWKEKALKAVDIGGSSYNNLKRLISEAFRYGN